MEELKSIEGKTIKNVSFPNVLLFKYKRHDGSEYESDYHDDNILIEFTDGTFAKLASWDHESYSSGIKIELAGPTNT